MEVCTGARTNYGAQRGYRSQFGSRIAWVFRSLFSACLRWLRDMGVPSIPSQEERPLPERLGKILQLPMGDEDR